MTLGIVATLKIQAGKTDEFETFFKELQAKVRANEKGCLQYDLCRAKDDPTTYVIMEQYADAGALEMHGKSEYFKAAGPKFAGVLAGAPQIVRLDKLS
ncbi:MAG: antibiotic biosynthesis monooxygenase [Alphaproteobacteria bacterium]|nr:antibiotic biosynthesis monooxygenase [Alphaproteobacteria bacterium]